ncbi:UNVERIFIED_CONTAM: Glucan endo-1,3-beta-glucosidase 1 [Sesamum radiatum]|uniref:Glucan endo-1,3-beta-glucosidase 1 n=1 Tax=Sesamum radiatum TaxID=300843 RepID=A0AAW2MVI9_SESRA
MIEPNLPDDRHRFSHSGLHTGNSFSDNTYHKSRKSAGPVINPVTTPGTNNPGGQPVTNPATPTGGIPATTPAVGPPAATNAPAVPGQSWCVAKNGVPEKTVQQALDYACGIGGADCSGIQQGASCYNPNTLQNHASYAFNSYYQKNPVQTSCDFGGAAVITNVNPSSGSCIFANSASSSTSPTTASPTTPTPTTASPVTPTPTTASSTGATPTSTGAPPAILNSSYPALGGATTGYGDSPLSGNSSSISMSSSLRPFIGCIVVVASIITGRLV